MLNDWNFLACVATSNNLQTDTHTYTIVLLRKEYDDSLVERSPAVANVSRNYAVADLPRRLA